MRSWLDPQEREDALRLSWRAFKDKYPDRTEGSYRGFRRDYRAGRRRLLRDEAFEQLVDAAGLTEPQEAEDQELQQGILDALRKRMLTVEELADALDRGPAKIRWALDGLREAGYEVAVDDLGDVTLDRQYKATNFIIDIDVSAYYGQLVKLGLISCPHFGNRYRQLGALTTFYRICERERVEAVLNMGDLTDGHGVYRGQEFDLYAHGEDEQVACTVAEYPQSTVPTYVIAGNHDYSYMKRAGANVVRRVCDQRPDLHYAGMIAATFMVGKVKILLVHVRTGVPYARSYRSQKLNEQLGRGERVPDVFGIGGLHVIDYVHYLGVHTFLAGCFQGQTPYLKEKGLYPEIGGWLAEFNLSPEGALNRCKLEWIGFEEQSEF